MKPFDEYLPMWIWWVALVAGFGFCAWQIYSGTYQTKKRHEKWLRTVRRADAPYGWLFSTLGWFIVGAFGLGAIVFRYVRMH